MESVWLDLVVKVLAVIVLMLMAYSWGISSGKFQPKKGEEYIKTDSSQEEVEDEYTCVICGKKSSKLDVVFTRSLVPICRHCYSGIIDLEKKEIRK